MPDFANDERVGEAAEGGATLARGFEHERTEMSRWLEMVERLKRDAAWAADDDGPIEVVQTHISVLLLGRDRVLKLKKPVDFGFLDFTTPARRREACEAEVKLNRRLCPGIYLGVYPVVERAPEGERRRTIDHGVLMKRLPQERMLDRLVASDEVSEEIIDRVAERLAEFHARAARDESVSAHGSPAVVRRNWEENYRQAAPFIGRTTTAEDFALVRERVERWLDENGELLRERAAEGFVRDGHGDVRCESVCVTDEVCIFDCIEFNERFRCGDVASEAAFLSMDLHARGRPDLAYYFCERYAARASTGPDFFRLLPFYRCYRAFVRGKVLSFELDEPEVDERERQRARLRAQVYFDLARRYADRRDEPLVIAVGGLSGSGKTCVARAVAEELGYRVVSSDAVRKSLFENTRLDAYGEGAYDEEGNRATYSRMFEESRELLAGEGGAVLDATFRRARDREESRRAAETLGARWLFIECRLDEAEARRRLELRTASGEGLSDATWETYKRQRAEFEPSDELPDSARLILDAGGDRLHTAHAATDWIRVTSHQSSVVSNQSSVKPPLSGRRV